MFHIGPRKDAVRLYMLLLLVLTVVVRGLRLGTLMIYAFKYKYASTTLVYRDSF